MRNFKWSVCVMDDVVLFNFVIFYADEVVCFRSGGFVTIGSIRYGVRLGAVSPPPPAAHYRATVGFLHQKRYENQKFPDECYCDVVNLPWSRSITSASQIPFLVDEPQPSINNYSIFKPVNSVDTPNSYYTASTSSTSLQNIDDKKTKLSSTTDDNDSCCDYLKTVQQVQQYNPQQLRRKVIVRSQSDTGASFIKNYNRDNNNQCTNTSNTLPKQREQIRYDNLERLNKFRFGGNRTNNKDTSDTSSGTKTFYNKSKKPPSLQTSEEKAERLRELTDRWKKATSKKYQNIEDGGQYGPVPPPRTRHSGSHHLYTTTHTKPYYQDHSKYDQHYHPSTGHYQRPMKMTEEEPTESTPVFTTPAPIISHTKTNSDSKTIGSNTQRTVPYRSMSFSHVDYSPQDGKYVRRRKNETEDTLGGILTIPRKKNSQDHTRPSETNSDIPNDTDDEVTKILQNINISDEFNLLKPSNFPDVCDIKNEFLPVNQRLTEEIEDAPNDNTETVNTEDKKRDRSKRRKGMYISQWPDQRHPDDNETTTPPLNENEDYFDLSKQCVDLKPDSNIPENDDLPKLVQYSRTDSLSENELEQLERRSITPNRENPQSTNQSELSDSEIRNSVGSPRPPRRYSKRPIRGPYGQMLEAEMNKPSENKNYRNKNQKNDLKFLDDYTPNEQRSISPKIISSSNNSIDNTESNRSLDSTLIKNNLKNSPKKSNHNEISSSAPTSVLNESDVEDTRLFTHLRTISSPSKLEAIPVNERTTNITPSSELLHELLRGSSERLTVASLSDSNPTIGIDSIIQVVSTIYIILGHVFIPIFVQKYLS